MSTPSDSTSRPTKRSHHGPIQAYFSPRRPMADITGMNDQCQSASTDDHITEERATKRIKLSGSGTLTRTKSTCANNDTPIFSKPASNVATASTAAATVPERKTFTVEDADAEEEEEEEDNEDVAPRVVQRLRPCTNMRMFMRESGMPFQSRVGSAYYHAMDWRDEVSHFYSRPVDKYKVLANNQTTLPFTTKALNKCSLVSIGDESGLVRLLETSKDVDPGFGKDWYTIQCHENAVFDLSWSKDDLQFATASGDHTVRLFDVQKKALLGVYHDHRSSIKQVNHHPTNPFILSSCSRDGDIHIWDTRIKATAQTDDGLASTKPVNSIIDAHTATSRRGKFSEVSVTAAIWLPSAPSDTIISACEANACIKFWDLRSTATSRRTRAKPSPRCIAQSSLPQHHTLSSQRPYGINSLTLSHDGARLYALCRDSIIYTYATSHIEKGPIHAYSHPRLLASTFFVKTSLSRDGSLLAAGSSDGTPILFPTDESYLNRRQYPERTSQKSQPQPDSQLDTTPGSQVPPSSQPSSSQKLTPSQLASKYLPIGPGMPLVGAFDIEVTDLDWTMDGDLVAISDDRTARCFRGDGNGEEVETLLEAETSAERYEWGYACEAEDATV